MGYSLRTGVTCRQSGGFTFFLDLDRDRYVAIEGAANAAFDRLVANAPCSEGDQGLVAQFITEGLIVETAGLQRPEPCAHVSTTIDSAIDLAVDRHIKPPASAALARIVLAKWSLRRIGLARTLERLARRKRRRAGHPGVADRLVRISAAFERCNAFASPLDQCLPRSIAVAHRMLDLGLCPTLLIGVRAQPFAAHCWIESGDLIVNDRRDTVTPFAPILMI